MSPFSDAIERIRSGEGGSTKSKIRGWQSEQDRKRVASKSRIALVTISLQRVTSLRVVLCAIAADFNIVFCASKLSLHSTTLCALLLSSLFWFLSLLLSAQNAQSESNHVTACFFCTSSGTIHPQLQRFVLLCQQETVVSCQTPRL